VRTPLCHNSLLTGNNTGNFALSFADIGNKSQSERILAGKTGLLWVIGTGIYQRYNRESQFPVARF
jgi:hypothetical protein